MSKARFLPLVLLVAFVGYKYLIPKPQPTAPSWQPTAVQQSAVQPVKAILSVNPEAAAELEKMYWAVAEVVESDTRVLKSTADVRQAYNAAGSLAVQHGELPLVSGLPEATDAYLTETIGNKVEPLTAGKRAAVVDAFRTLAWAAK